MGIYVKGLEMPKTCWECPLFDWDLHYIKCKVTNRHFLISLDERSDTCPLAEVPPHGRLIDADAFLKMMEDLKDPEKSGDEWVFRICRGAIARMPVIIEAENNFKGE